MNLLIQAANIYTPAALKRKKLEELFACTAAAFGCEMPGVQGLPYDELLQSYARFTAAQANQALRRAIPDVLAQAAPRGSATPDVLPKPATAQAKPQEPLLAMTPSQGVIASGFCEAISTPPVIASGFCEAISAPGNRDEIASSQEPLLAMTADESGRDLAEVQRRLYDGAYRMGQELRRAFRVANTTDALAAARVLYRALGIDLRATPAGEVTVHRCFFSDYYSSPVCRVIASLDKGLFAGLSDGGQLSFTQRITEGSDCCKADFRPSPCDRGRSLTTQVG